MIRVAGLEHGRRILWDIKSYSYTQPIATLSYLVLVATAIFVFFSQWGYDDPYITYRYAENLQRGLGFVYNPGERALSTTTPLFTLLLGFFANFWHDLPRLANLIDAFSLAVGALFLWSLAARWQWPFVGWVGLLLYPTFPHMLVTMSSEIPLYVALCLGAIAFYAHERYRAAAILAALAVLTRSDALLVPMLLAAHYILRVRRPMPWGAVALFLCLTVPWFVFAWIYFGSPLPTTLLSKQQQTVLAASQHFAPGLLTFVQDYLKLFHYQVAAILVLFGLGFMLGRARRWALIFAWTILYFATYAVLGVTRYFWYYAPLVPAYLVALGLGVTAIGERQSIFRSRVIATQNLQAKLLQLTCALLMAWLSLAQIQDLARMQQHPDQRLLIYRAVGEWLQSNTPPDATVGTLEVGIIGFYARRPMIDFAGLIQLPVATRLRADSTYEDAAIWASEHYRPAYVVLDDGAFPHLEQGYITERCQPTQHFPGADYAYSENMTIYTCRN